MRRRSRPAVLAGLLGAAALLLSSCTVPLPVVTFYGNRTAVNVQPALWCHVDTAALTVSCPATPDPADDGHLTMAPAQPLQINVPTEIGDDPWLVAFAYTDAAGKTQTGRTEVFTDGRLAYTLESLPTTAQLTRVEVQSGLLPTQAADGSTVIAASRTWVLLVSPKVIQPGAVP
jgi:hypothetical protein